MDEQSWDRVQAIFQTVCNLGRDERERALKEACGQNGELLTEVSSLLFYHDRSEGFLEHDLAQAVTLRGLNGETVALEIPGPYRVDKPLGVGGMGTVFKAEQLKPVQRPVALKVIHQNVKDGSFLERFKFERQTLAMMNHPNIAHVLDAGETGDGRPFFTMEFVDGIAITKFSDEHDLTLDQRIDLFLQVCEGVAHAHSKGIIHRDLKPSNILVATESGKAVPKIIDFGIARVMGSPHAEASEAAVLATAIGTPAYMSPEQVTSKEVDTITDIYALGMVLYHLLVGNLPFQKDEYEKTEVMTVLRLIGKKSIPCPSQRLLQLGPEAVKQAECRGVSLKQLTKAIHGDLDHIVMKALARDPKQRYQSVGDMVADIHRYRKLLPVRAAPKSFWGYAAKFARRNKTGVVFSSALILAVVAAMISLIWGNRQARRSVEQADASNRVNQIITKLLIEANPRYLNGPVSTEKLLDDAAHSLIGSDLAAEDSAEYHTMFGRLYSDSKLSRKSTGHYRSAYDLLKESLRPNDIKLIGAKHNYAAEMVQVGDADHLAQALPLLEEVLASRLKKFGENHRDTLRTKRALANWHAAQGDFGRAEAIYNEIYNKQVALWSATDPDAMVTLHQRATLAGRTGDFSLAEKLFRESRTNCLVVYGPKNLNTVDAMYGLFRALVNLNKIHEGISLGQDTLALSLEVLGLHHDLTLKTRMALITAYKSDQLPADQLATMFQSMLDVQLEVMGPTDPDTLHAMNNMADFFMEQSLLKEAELLKLEEIAAWERLKGPNHYDVFGQSVTLAQIYYQAKDLQQADLLCRKIISGYEGLNLKNAFYRFTQVLHGCVLNELGKHQEGEALIQAGMDALYTDGGGLKIEACKTLFEHYLSNGMVLKSQRI